MAAIAQQPAQTDYRAAWRGFKLGLWQKEINVRDFIQLNYDPYDGDELFLAGPTLVTATVGNLTPEFHDVTPPPGIGTDGAELSVSPDGTKIAAKLGKYYPDLSGNPLGRGVLFVTDTSMTTFRQLTTLTDRATGDGAIGHSNPIWSPDGKYIAFSIAYSEAAFALAPPGCPEELVVPASGESIPIDDINDGPALQFTVTAPD